MTRDYDKSHFTHLFPDSYKDAVKSAHFMGDLSSKSNGDHWVHYHCAELKKMLGRPHYLRILGTLEDAGFIEMNRHYGQNRLDGKHFTKSFRIPSDPFRSIHPSMCSHDPVQCQRETGPHQDNTIQMEDMI